MIGVKHVDQEVGHMYIFARSPGQDSEHLVDREPCCVLMPANCLVFSMRLDVRLSVTRHPDT